MTTEPDKFLEAFIEINDCGGCYDPNCGICQSAAAYLRERFVTREEYEHVVCAGSAAADLHLSRAAALTAERDRLRALVKELADDLEAEVNDRWGYDERLKHKLDRDMDVVNRAHQALNPEQTELEDWDGE